MNFTYKDYQALIGLLRENGYAFSSYVNYPGKGKCVILRHDIDYSLEQAVKLARIEKDLGVRSTYFVLLSSDFYNPASSSSYRYLHEILDLGHDIGLHFDETAYSYERFGMEYFIRKEARILSDLIDVNINSFSLHRPNHFSLETEIRIPGLINSYGEEFFHGFKYLSDSRRRWREPVEEIIEKGEFEKLHILTHAFWYHEEDLTISETILDFIRSASRERKLTMKDNITDLEHILLEAGESL